MRAIDIPSVIAVDIRALQAAELVHSASSAENFSFYVANTDLGPAVGPRLSQVREEVASQPRSIAKVTQACGICVAGMVAFADLYAHLQSLLTVQTEDGEILHFRYYDPRVLRVFLPTCTPHQLLQFFGPITAFYVEDEDPRYCLVFTHQNGTLHVQRIDLEEPLTDAANG